MKTTTLFFDRSLPIKFGSLAVTALLMTVVMLPQPAPQVYAGRYDAQIRAYQAQIADYRSRSNDLQAQADTLQNKLDELKLQQDMIITKINLTTTQSNQLADQIKDAESKIKSQAIALRENLKEQYLSDGTSALDILLNSKSVSDYIDRQTKQRLVGDKIKQSVAEIKQAKLDLEKKKRRADALLVSQKQQKQALDDSRAEQQALLDQTHGQEAVYQELTKNNQAKIAELERLQAEEIAARMRTRGGSRLRTAAGAACGGGYPDRWCHAPKDAMTDSYGMYSRECVSYAAFKVASTYGWPSYWTRGGNDAKNWLARANKYGIPTGSTPKPGSVAVMRNGTYGHVAWVESVNSDGTFNYSDYNSDNRGNYAMHYNASPAMFDGYIYFAQMP